MTRLNNECRRSLCCIQKATQLNTGICGRLPKKTFLSVTKYDMQQELWSLDYFPES